MSFFSRTIVVDYIDAQLEYFDPLFLVAEDNSS
jgi:hypothetical protein